MSRLWQVIRCLAWPSYRKRLEAHRGWCTVVGAATYLLGRSDWDRGDHAAALIFSDKMKELNR